MWGLVCAYHTYIHTSEGDILTYLPYLFFFFFFPSRTPPRGAYKVSNDPRVGVGVGVGIGGYDGGSRWRRGEKERVGGGGGGRRGGRKGWGIGDEGVRKGLGDVAVSPWKSFRFWGAGNIFWWGFLFVCGWVIDFVSRFCVVRIRPLVFFAFFQRGFDYGAPEMGIGGMDRGERESWGDFGVADNGERLN